MIQNPSDSKFDTIHPENYDFLWTVGVPFLWCSIHHQNNYSSRDFVSCHKGNSYTLFISKKERSRLAQEGLRFYTTELDSYSKKLKENIPLYQKKIEDIKKQDIHILTNTELLTEFEAMLKLVSSLWGDYFPLEYHHTDLLSKIIVDDDKKYDLQKLKKDMEMMASVKFSWRQLLNDTWYEGNIINKFADEIKKRFELSYNVYTYRYNELIDILKGKKVTVPDRSGYVVYGLFSEGKDIIGKEAEIIYNRLNNIDSRIREFRGNIGNKGYYKGTVKKINFSAETDFIAEIASMEKGQILVSGSTGPEMILACKKAGAIVTDEGGIISHAALVSRELNIPSVIATKIATKVLNNGDLVEVDANNGIVRKLS